MSRKMLASDGGDGSGIMRVFRRTMTFTLALRHYR